MKIINHAITNKITDFISFLKNNVKRCLILLMATIVLFFAIKKIATTIITYINADSPIVTIIATNKKKYAPGEPIKPEDFIVQSVKENGYKETLSSDKYTLSIDAPKAVGKKTSVTITFAENTNINTTICVDNVRDYITDFKCGYPNIEDVKAVLYSNGELCFEGKGDVLAFTNGHYPWQEYVREYTITAVTFMENVYPLSMDGWFANMDTLIYVGTIPASVESMSQTYQNCTALINGVDWSNCKKLINVNQIYAGCKSLKAAPAIPSSVRTAVGAYQDCINLQETPDMYRAYALIDATSMYYNCTKLSTINGMPPNVSNLTSMFRECINLKAMPVIPSSAVIMDSTFYKDISLMSMTTLPEKITDISSCFYGCEKLNGPISINANPQKYASFMKNTAIATKVDLHGTSILLDVLVNDAQNPNGNITVNGNSADPELNSYSSALQKASNDTETTETDKTIN